MARHKKHPEHENLERWLVSYADFITLLFATFTALYAIAQSKLTDNHKAAEEIKKSFQQETLLKGIASVFQGQSTPTDKPNPAFEETGKGEGVVGKYESLILT
ncbi:MAG: flagellar motor protein MotB, partial [Vampirovibrionales bacterium]